MFQVSNPYTGEDTRALTNSVHDWALRGLGMGQISPNDGTPGTVAGSTHDSGGGGAVLRVPSDFVSKLQLWAGSHPRGAGFYQHHPAMKRHAIRRAYRMDGNNPPPVLPGLGVDESHISGLGVLESQISGLGNGEYDPSIYTGVTQLDPTVAVSTYNPGNPNNFEVPGNSGGGFDWNQLISEVLPYAGNISKLVLTPGGSYTSTNPLTGQSMTYTGTGQPTTSLNIPGLTTLGGSGISGTTMLLFAAVGLAVLLMAKR